MVVKRKKKRTKGLGFHIPLQGPPPKDIKIFPEISLLKISTTSV
jgi:hypothetical protein